MRKVIIAFVVSLLCVVWNTSHAQCFVPDADIEGPYIELTGILVWDVYPCLPDEECPPCLTLVLRTKQLTYYLTGAKVEEFSFPEGESIVKVVVRGVADYKNPFYWLKVDDIRLSEDPITTNFYTYGCVQNESGEKLPNIRIIVHTSDWIVSDTIYSQADGTFSSIIRDIDYSIKSMNVTAEDPKGFYETRTHEGIEYVYECGMDFNPETDVASNMSPLIFSLHKKTNSTSFASLCDTWNVLEDNVIFRQCSTYHYRLTHDTIINNINYVALEKDGQYQGSMREKNNARIYYYPSDATHEYLLYAFDAKVGDTFTNVWFGGKAKWFPSGSKVSIREVQETTPKIFLLDVEYTRDGTEETVIWDLYYWIDGVGLSLGPCGDVYCPFSCCYGGPDLSILCAYKNGEQIYSSARSDELGCEYNYDPESINDIETRRSFTKIIRDGHLLILRGDKTYTLTGQELK